VRSKLHLVQVAEAEEPRGVELPEHVQLSLAGIAGQAKEGLLALAVGTGLAVLHETMEWEVERVVEPVGEQVQTAARSTSKSAVSRAFVARTRTALEQLLGRDLSELELAVVMIDGIDLADVTHVVALGITTDGTKIPLSLREGSTENATVATALLSRPG